MTDRSDMERLEATCKALLVDLIRVAEKQAANDDWGSAEDLTGDIDERNLPAIENAKSVLERAGYVVTTERLAPLEAAEIIDGLEVHRADLQADHRDALVQAVLDALNEADLRDAADVFSEYVAIPGDRIAQRDHALADRLEAAANALHALEAEKDEPPMS